MPIQNRMQHKPGMVVDMDILGLQQRRHAISQQQTEGEDDMNEGTYLEIEDTVDVDTSDLHAACRAVVRDLNLPSVVCKATEDASAHGSALVQVQDFQTQLSTIQAQLNALASVLRDGKDLKVNEDSVWARAREVDGSLKLLGEAAAALAEALRQLCSEGVIAERTLSLNQQINRFNAHNQARDRRSEQDLRARQPAPLPIHRGYASM